MSDSASGTGYGRRDVILYDDRCPMCTFQSRLLSWLDWFDRVRLVPISREEAGRLAPDLTREALLEAIHCVRPDGRIDRGARALRRVGMRMPALVPLALVLWLPGVIQVAERVYMFVSRRRETLSKMFGCRQACSVMPGRRREGEAEPEPKEAAPAEDRGG